MGMPLPSTNMIKRALTGFVVGLIGLLSFLAGGWVLLAVILLVTIFGSLEYVKILNCKGFYPFKTTILLVSFGFAVLASIKEYELFPLILTLGTIVAFCSVIFKGRQPYIANVATTALGFLYCGWLPAHIIMLRQLDSTRLGFFTFEMNNGIIYLFMFFFGVLATDVGAFYFGKKFGKHKLSPVISPNKTVEGSLGGALSTLIICGVIGWYTNLAIIHTVLIALIITTFAQLGDLSESLMKRDAGVKDSGDSLPGHGGILDRTDGYIFAAPAVYYYVYFAILHNDINIYLSVWMEKILNAFGN